MASKDSTARDLVDTQESAEIPVAQEQSEPTLVDTNPNKIGEIQIDLKQPDGTKEKAVLVAVDAESGKETIAKRNKTGGIELETATPLEIKNENKKNVTIAELNASFDAALQSYVTASGKEIPTISKADRNRMIKEAKLADNPNAALIDFIKTHPALSEQPEANDKMDVGPKFIEMTPDPIYSKGPKAVEQRLLELEKLLGSTKDADETDQLTAEIYRLATALPIIKEVDRLNTLEQAVQTAQTTLNKLSGNQKPEKSQPDKKIGHLGTQVLGTTGRINALNETLQTEQKELDALIASTEQGTNTDRITAEQHTLQQLESDTSQLKAQSESLEKSGLSYDALLPGTDAKLYDELVAQNAYNADETQNAIAALLQDERTSQKARETILLFQKDLREDDKRDSKKTEPKEKAEQDRQTKIRDLEAQLNENLRQQSEILQHAPSVEERLLDDEFEFIKQLRALRTKEENQIGDANYNAQTQKIVQIMINKRGTTSSDTGTLNPLQDFPPEKILSAEATPITDEDVPFEHVTEPVTPLGTKLPDRDVTKLDASALEALKEDDARFTKIYDEGTETEPPEQPKTTSTADAEDNVFQDVSELPVSIETKTKPAETPLKIETKIQPPETINTEKIVDTYITNVANNLREDIVRFKSGTVRINFDHVLEMLRQDIVRLERNPDIEIINDFDLIEKVQSDGGLKPEQIQKALDSLRALLAEGEAAQQEVARQSTEQSQEEQTEPESPKEIEQMTETAGGMSYEGADATLIDAWNSYSDDDNAKNSLIAFGFPKKLVLKAKTLGDLWKAYNRPPMFTNGEKIRSAMSRFMEEASVNTENERRDAMNEKARDLPNFMPQPMVESFSRNTEAQASLKQKADRRSTPKVDARLGVDIPEPVPGLEAIDDIDEKGFEPLIENQEDREFYDRLQAQVAKNKADAEEPPLIEEAPSAPKNRELGSNVNGIKFEFRQDENGTFIMELPQAGGNIELGQDEYTARQAMEHAKQYAIQHPDGLSDPKNIPKLLEEAGTQFLALEKQQEQYAKTVGEDLAGVDAVRIAYDKLSVTDKRVNGFPATWNEVANPPKASIFKRVFGNPKKDRKDLFTKIKNVIRAK